MFIIKKKNVWRLIKAAKLPCDLTVSMRSIIQSDSVLREHQGADNSHSKHVRRQVSEIFSVESCFKTMAAPVSEEVFRLKYK